MSELGAIAERVWSRIQRNPAKFGAEMILEVITAYEAIKAEEEE